ncbi:uncharacterized protein RJT20DRAFT_137482 [Scheffersomyces xylosifermentans]|uniref:uncharacterized protein n=1 Tax=Scheffersomyces xylosifermentans TaxID=1304137 RepID=UPI00315D5FC8
MYTTIELVFSLIAAINFVTALVIYIKDKRTGASIQSGANFRSFKICISMSIIFGLLSMALLTNNIRYDLATRSSNASRYPIIQNGTNLPTQSCSDSKPINMNTSG